MTRKSEKCYEHVFRSIRENILNLSEGGSIMSDYELAMRNALKSVFPNLNFLACWFHFNQAIIKKCKKIPRFLKKVMNHPEGDRLLHKFLALPLLPANRIRSAFNMLKLEANAADGSLWKEFLTYFEKQWILKVCKMLFLFCKNDFFLKILS